MRKEKKHMKVIIRKRNKKRGRGEREQEKGERKKGVSGGMGGNTREERRER